MKKDRKVTHHRYFGRFQSLLHRHSDPRPQIGAGVLELFPSHFGLEVFVVDQAFDLNEGETQTTSNKAGNKPRPPAFELAYYVQVSKENAFWSQIFIVSWAFQIERKKSQFSSLNLSNKPYSWPRVHFSTNNALVGDDGSQIRHSSAAMCVCVAYFGKSGALLHSIPVCTSYETINFLWSVSNKTDF